MSPAPSHPHFGGKEGVLGLCLLFRHVGQAVWGRGRGSDWGELEEDEKKRCREVMDFGCGEKGPQTHLRVSASPGVVLPLAPSECLKAPNACTTPGEGDTSRVPFPAQVPPWWR